MKLSAIIAPLIEAKAPHDQILAVILAFEAQQEDALERRRANDRERQNRRRHVMSRDVTVTASSHGGDARVEDNSLPRKIEPQERKEETRAKRASSPSEFEVWYQHYPHKVQRGAAERAFPRARKLASLETLIAAVQRYAKKADDRPWQNPATWLNGQGWLDEPATARPLPRGSPAHAVPELSELFAMAGERFSDERSAENFTGSRQALPNLSLVRSGRDGG